MSIKDLIARNRSYRRFDESYKISKATLLDFIDAARLSGSARNMQPLKYFLACENDLNKIIFPTLAWAGYIKEWDGPTEGERPTAYIIQLHDTSIAPNFFCDDGISAQSMLLTAVEKGLGGCMIASVKKQELKTILKLPEHLEIIQVIALGKPVEEVVIEDIQNNDVQYYRDQNMVHHVPKRTLSELIIN